MPLRLNPAGVPICRFYNYDKGGCMKGEQCELDHVHCHICLRQNHRSLECPYFTDDKEFKKFCNTYTLLNTRPSTYQKKTVLGDVIKWETAELPLECRGDDGQLRRCRRHKRFEAELLSGLPKGSAFLDVGAHFGDTTLTMAVHARVIGREDLRFYAFEPNKEKCRWIKKTARDNEVQVTVVNCAVGDTQRSVVPERGGKSRAVYDGSLIYEEAEEGEGDESDSGTGSGSSDGEHDDKGVVRMISLDTMVDEISPLGLLHLDVEGWESLSLRGSTEVLRRSSKPSYVIAEVWEDKDCARRGVEGGMEEKVCNVMEENHLDFVRGEDIKDQERNILFVRS